MRKTGTLEYRPSDRIIRMASVRVGVDPDTRHASCTTLNVSTLIRQRGIHEESWVPIFDSKHVEPLILKTIREFVDMTWCESRLIQSQPVEPFSV
jgi:hypothetical protein